MTRLRPRAATMPSTTTPAPGSMPGHAPAALEHDQQLAAPVRDRALERGDTGPRLDPHRLDPSRDPGRLTGAEVADRHRARGEAARGGLWKPAARSAAVLAPAACAARLDSSVPNSASCTACEPCSPPAFQGTSCLRRLPSWKGTIVAFTFGSWSTKAAMWSAVWSCRTRRHSPENTRWGKQHADLGLAVGCDLGDQLHRRPREAPVRALDEVEGKARQPELHPLALELGRVRAVEHEVHRPELVGVERPRVLERPGRGEVEPVDEHEHDVAAQDRGDGRVGDVLLELAGAPLRTACGAGSGWARG